MNEKINEIKKMITMYTSALRIVETKVQILNENYKNTGHNPIEHIKTRVKSIESIIEKAKRKNIEMEISAIKEEIEDIAGIRIICPFSKDIYELAQILKEQEDVEFIKEIDYITNPKPSGYRSYHMIVKVPVYLPNKTEKIKVEIQIRTEAMDFWACLEHKAKYKYNGKIPAHLSNEFKVCSDKIAELDERMFLLQDIIALINE